MARRTRSGAGADERQPAGAVAAQAEFSPHKRRRLAGTAGTRAGQRVSPPVTRSSASALNTAVACATCHRRPAKADELVRCPRCEVTVCTVCTRTCTSSGPASLPSTPELSYSATPVGTTPYGSPQRGVLALEDLAGAVVAKRRRRASDSGDAAQINVVGVVGGDGHWTEDLTLGEGCGRTVCKGCAIEHQDDNTTTCLDCYGMPLHIPARRGFADRFPSGAFDFALSPEGGASTPALSPSPSLPL